MTRGNIILLAIISTLLQSETVPALTSENIVNGVPSPPGFFTYHVYVNHRANECGGAIIGPSLVVTAAHCVSDENGNFLNSPIKVTAGVVDLRKRPPSRVEAFVVKIYVPKEFQMTNIFPPKANLAVLKLNKDLTSRPSNNLKVLQLTPNIPKYRDLSGRVGFVTGFGIDALHFKPYWNSQGDFVFFGSQSHKLHCAGATVWPKGSYTGNEHLSIDDQHLCAQTHQRESEISRIPEGLCKGDGGAPLVIQGKYLIGILTAVPSDCDESRDPAIYTDTSEFREFFDRAYADDCDEQYMICRNY